MKLIVIPYLDQLNDLLLLLGRDAAREHDLTEAGHAQPLAPELGVLADDRG